MEKTYDERLKEYYLKIWLTNKEILERAAIITDPGKRAEFIEGQKAKRDKVKNEGFPKVTVSDLQADGTFKEVENKGNSSVDPLTAFTPLAGLFKSPALESIKKTQRLIADIVELTAENSDLILQNEIYRAKDQAYLENLFNEADSRGTKQETIDFLIQSKYWIVNKYESDFRPELTDDKEYKTLTDRINERIEELKAPTELQSKETKIKISIQPFQFVELVKALQIEGIVKGELKEIVKEFSCFFQLEKEMNPNTFSKNYSKFEAREVKPKFLNQLLKGITNDLETKKDIKEKLNTKR